MNILEIWRHLKEKKVPPPGLMSDPLVNMLAKAASVRGRLQELSSLERSICAISHKEPDRVPVSPILCSGARHISNIAFPDYALNADKAAQAYMDGFEFVGGDVIILLFDLSVEAADFGQAMVYPLNSTPMPDYNNPLIKDRDGYRQLARINFTEAARMQEFVRLCRIMVQKTGLGAIVSGFVFGPLGILSMLRGAENLFKDCRLYPDDVKAACETITAVLIDFVKAQCAAGVPAIVIDTLFASRSALPKDLWEEIEGPFAREISLAIKETGRIVAIHNCGEAPYFDAQIRSMEPAIISFAHLPDDCSSAGEMKQRYGDTVTLMGYVPTPLLVHGTPAQVMDECRRHIDQLADGGGFILSPGCEYPPNASLVNAFAVVNAARKYGRK